MLVTLAILAYAAGLIWTFVEPRGPTAADLTEVETSKARFIRRREIIDEARKMVARFYTMNSTDWHRTITCSPAYSAVAPHLSPQYFKQLHAKARTITIGAVHQEPIASFVAELDRLEREWGLS